MSERGGWRAGRERKNGACRNAKSSSAAEDLTMLEPRSICVVLDVKGNKGILVGENEEEEGADKTIDQQQITSFCIGFWLGPF